MSVIEIQGLRKAFLRGFLRRRTEALRGISLNVNRAEIFGFLGPNGAGKTTTIKILMGLIYPSAGQVRVLDAVVGDRRAKARIGYLPENPYFYDYLTAVELLDMVGRIHGLDHAARRRRGELLLAKVGLETAASRPLRSYSKGMLQRVGLAQALVGDPELVVLDEPMSGLDPIGRKEVRDVILELREQGKTVFFSTHILSDAAALCDRVAILVAGEIRETGALGELLDPRVAGVDVVWVPKQADDAVPETVAEVHRRSADGLVTQCTGLDQANGVIGQILASGGQIRQVTPHRQSLEELFVVEARLPPGRKKAS